MATFRAMALLFLAGTALAQSAFTACDVDPQIAPELRKAVAAAGDPQLPFAARMAPFRALLDRYPTDSFVNRFYLSRLSGYNVRPVYDSQLPRYEALLRAHPDDPAARYLFAQATILRDPKNSAVMLEELVRQDPQSPWPHLALTHAYGRIKPLDTAKVLEHLRQFVQTCPATLDQGALQTIASDGDAVMKQETVERLRKQLAGRADWQALRAWPVLWEMEFQVTPAAKHGELRTRIQQDIAALREIQTDAPDGKLDAMRQGYTLANDADGRRQVATELMRVAPGSAAAADAGIEQWDEQNPYPDRSAPFAEFIAYHEKRWDAAKAWIDRWPNYGPAWTAALAALRAEGQDKNVVATLGRRIAAFLQQNPDSTLGFTDQPTLMVAERLAAAGVDLDLIPALLDRAATQSQARLDCDRKYAVRPMTEAEIARNFQSESWVTRKVQAILQARQGEAVASHATLQTLLKATDAASGDSLLAWRGITAACEAALLTESAGLARDAIARMSNTLATEPTATPVEIRTHGMHEADYWQSRARLSELEGRSADAVAFYMRATNATPRNFDPVGRGRFAALAEKAWSKLGGTADAWLAYNPDAAGSQPQAQWRDVHGPMPEFSLEDSAGRPVRAADFHGKTVFINVWATWCGPCQGELPWVQRLYDAVKDHRDVAILTFNVDENPGVIAQFMKEHGFTFPVVLAHDYIDNTMKVDAIPRNWIVDGEGTLRFERQAGFDETFLKDTMEAMARAK